MPAHMLAFVIEQQAVATVARQHGAGARRCPQHEDWRLLLGLER